MLPNKDYNENSPDSMFSKVLTRLDAQDATLDKILTQALKTNGRVLNLEKTVAEHVSYWRVFAWILGGIGAVLAPFLLSLIHL